jgi:uncharacterized protein
MRKAMLTIGAILVAAGAPGAACAEEADRPSFDCRQARTPVERAICDGGQLGMLDRAMAALYRAVRERVPAVDAEQRQWLAARNSQCGQAKPDTDCLIGLHKRRVAALVEKARGLGLLRGTAITGDYAYRQKGEAGSMFLAEMPDGSVYVMVDTVNVNHRSPHSCSLTERVRERRGETLVIADTKTSAKCALQVTVAGARATMREAPKDCFELAQHWCGAHGYMLGTYVRR